MSDDEIDPSLEGMDGLHVGQRATSARRRNPGKYTDKSMRRVQSLRSSSRERSAAEPVIIGDNDHVRGACVNDFGTIRPCRDLVTRVNYRTTYVKKDRLPLQMLFAMLLDEQPEVVRTYDGSLVRSYLAGVVARALSGDDPMEPTSANNLVGFANRAVTLLSQIETMTGRTDPIEVLAERYMTPIANLAESCRILRSSIRRVNDTSVSNILNNLKTLVDEAVPQVRLWAYDTQSPKDVSTVLIRRGQLRDHPLESLKYALDRSIEMFGNDRRAEAAAIIQQHERRQERRRNAPPPPPRNANRTRNEGSGRRGENEARGTRTGRTDSRRGRGGTTSEQKRSRPTAKTSSSTSGTDRRHGLESHPIETSYASPDITVPPPTPGHFLDVPSTSRATDVEPTGSQQPAKRALGKKKRKSAAGDKRRVTSAAKSAVVPDWLADVDEY